MLLNTAIRNVDGAVGSGLEVRGNDSFSGYNSAANQTGYSGTFLADPSSSNSHAVIYDRKYSEMNSTQSQFTSKKVDIVKRASGMNGKQYYKATAGINFEITSTGDQLPLPSSVDS